jgi:hypothetical protein
MTPRARRAVLIGGGVAVAATVVAAVIILLPNDKAPASAPAAGSTSTAPSRTAAEVADLFLTAFAKGDASTAAGLTDDPGASGRQLTAVWQGLAPKSVSAKTDALVAPAAGATTADAPMTITWTFGPDRTWSYPSTLPLAKSGETWRVHWTPALVHPKLTADRGLALRGQTGQAAVVDRDGKPLLVWQADGPKPADPAFAPLLGPAMARVAGEQGGKNGWHVALLDAAGAELESLAGAAAGDARPVTSTLSVPVQQAAQAAVQSVGQAAMLVAIQPSTGDLLAVAQNGPAGADPNALHGLYPPGSTFKIVTAAAVLQAGTADLDTVLPCPGSATIGTRAIHNAGFELGDVPLHTAFARSCNTTFAKLASDLPADALSRAASQFGLNADFVVPGIVTEAGKVVPADGVPQRVENGIGQGTVQASPFGLALMTATVASGRAVVPQLWRDLPTNVTTGYQPPPRAILDKLRTMMREVVTAGTAKDLAGRGAVFGKTGTAQFGDGVHSHGWFTGYRGDLAFAVFVDTGETSASAVSVSGKFLAAVH